MSVSFNAESFKSQRDLTLIPELPLREHRRKKETRQHPPVQWKLAAKPPDTLIGRRPEGFEPTKQVVRPRAHNRPQHSSEFIDFPIGKSDTQLLLPAKRPVQAAGEKSTIQQAIRGMLDAQVQEKQSRQLQVQRQKEAEDRLEEQRLQKQRRELEEAYRQEAREAWPYSPKKSPRGPYFKPKLSHTVSRKEPEHLSFDEMISEMKSAAKMQSRYTQHVLSDFEDMRRQLHPPAPFDSHFPMLRQESRFVPMHRNKSIASTSLDAGVSPHFTSYDSSVTPAARTQLQRLDRLMLFLEDNRREQSFLRPRFDIDEGV